MIASVQPQAQAGSPQGQPQQGAQEQGQPQQDPMAGMQSDIQDQEAEMSPEQIAGSALADIQGMDPLQQQNAMNTLRLSDPQLFSAVNNLKNQQQGSQNNILNTPLPEIKPSRSPTPTS